MNPDADKIDRNSGTNGKRQLLMIGALIVTGWLLTFPIRDLIAEYYYKRAGVVLDESPMEQLDDIDISRNTVPQLEAIQLLERSAAYAASQAMYYKALSDIHVRFGIWTEAMHAMGQALPEHEISPQAFYDRAAWNLKKAIILDPTNPDYHVALGWVYWKQGDDVSSGKELESAVTVCPSSTAVRYAVAQQYLLRAEKKKALVHAKSLAVLDDSYVVDESSQKLFIIERRTPDYLVRLSRSYLYKALEIAWRATDRNVQVIRSIAPNSTDAHEVVSLFLEKKGIDE